MRTHIRNTDASGNEAGSNMQDAARQPLSVLLYREKAGNTRKEKG